MIIHSVASLHKHFKCLFPENSLKPIIAVHASVCVGPQHKLVSLRSVLLYEFAVALLRKV